MPQTALDLVADALSRVRQLKPNDLAASPNPSRLLIDVREPEEYAQGHLPGAVNLPRGVLEFKIEAHPALTSPDQPQADRSRAIVVYCLSGGRSALAADTLQRMGFSNVQSLAGGIAAWREAALPTVID